MRKGGSVMLAFAVVFLLGVVIALLWGGRRQPERVVVIPQYIDRQPGRAPQRRGRWIWTLVFALVIGATLALWPRWTSATNHLPAATSTRGQADRPTGLVGYAAPIRPTRAAPAAIIDAAALNDEGMALMQQDRYADAELRFRQAIERKPEDYLAYNNLAFCLYERGKISAAIDAWQQALERNPASADAQAGLGMALFASGQAEAGRAHYQQALALNPGYADEGWMQADRLWSARALADSRPLR